MRKGLPTACVWHLNRTIMYDKMGSSEVLVNVAVEVNDVNEVNEEEVGDA